MQTTHVITIYWFIFFKKVPLKNGFGSLKISRSFGNKQDFTKVGTDRVAIVRALVFSESLTAFEGALKDARMKEAGKEEAVMAEHVEIAL